MALGQAQPLPPQPAPQPMLQQVTQPAPGAPVQQPQNPSLLGRMETGDRPAAARSVDDQLEIPAFLRRQAN